MTLQQKKRTLYIYYKKFAISISQWKIPYQNIWRAVESEPACVFEIGYQKYTTCNGKESILSEIKFFLVFGKKSHFLTIFHNFLEFSKILFYTLNIQLFRYLIIFSVKCIKRKWMPKADQVPHPPRLRILGVKCLLADTVRKWFEKTLAKVIRFMKYRKNPKNSDTRKKLLQSP